MANGQNIEVFAEPQPGTTNTPFPRRVRVSGGFLGLFPKYKVIPPFQPVFFGVWDEGDVAISTFTSILVTRLKTFRLALGEPGIPTPGTTIAILQQVNNNLAMILEKRKELLDSLNALTVVVDSMNKSANTKLEANTNILANQIQFDNFFKAYNGEKPELPKIDELFLTSLKEAIQLNSTMNNVGLVNNQINSVIDGAKSLLTGLTVYKSLQNYLNKVKSAVFAIFPKSDDTVKTETAAGTINT